METSTAAASERPTALSARWRMPAEWEPHERCLMAWPTRASLWHDIEEARRNEAGDRAGVHFRFNAWGERFPPWDRDAAVGEPLLEHLGIARIASPMVLEGGSISVDGHGTLITTEQCLLNPN